MERFMYSRLKYSIAFSSLLLNSHPVDAIVMRHDRDEQAFIEPATKFTRNDEQGMPQDARPSGKKLGHYGVLELYPRVSSFAAWIRATMTTANAR
jgi:hypothetical protein